MDKTTKIIVGVLVAAIVLLAGYIIIHPSTTIRFGGVAAPSPAGTTGTIKLLNQQVIASPATTTWASFYNGGADRIVSDVFFVNLAGGTSTVWMAVATSSSPTTLVDVNGNTMPAANYIFGALVGSSSPYLASTTPGSSGTTPALRLWSSGSYLNFQAATGTQTGLIGVTYFQD